MASAAALEPGSTLYELSQTLDISASNVPEKLVCKNCSQFLINAYKNACCDGALCEKCNTNAAGAACPYCKHSPAVSNPSKALRNTAKVFLRNLEKKDAVAAAAASEPQQPLASAAAAPTDATAQTDNKDSQSVEPSVKIEDAPALPSQESAINDDVVPSIEQPKQSSRRATMESNNSGNEPDDDDDEIQITVGDFDMSEIPDAGNGAMDDEWYGDDQQYYPQEKSGRESTRPPKQERTNSVADTNRPDMNQHNMPSEAMFGNGINNMNNMPMMNAQDMAQMQQMFQSAMANPQMAQQMMNGYPNMQNMFQTMQSMMGMQGMPMAMNGNQSWNGNMMPFGNQSFNPMMNNASFYQGQQFQNFQNGNFRDNRSGNFRGGRGRNKRGRGQYFQQQDHFSAGFNSNFQNYGYQNGGYNNNNNSYNQFDNSQQDSYTTNNQVSNDQTQDDDDDTFAPGGQDEVQEALGEEYKKKKTPTPQPEILPEPDIELVKQEEYQEEPSTHEVELHHEPNSPPHHTPQEEIAEAYREDLGYPTNNGTAPPSAPSGPSGKDVPYRARGSHGRYQSRGRGSFHGSNGYPPRSPARPISQHNNVSPATSQNVGTGIVGAPTGPRAMRQNDPAPRLNHTESETGFKIRGTASQIKDQRPTEYTPRSTPPRSNYEDDYDRDSRRRRDDRRYDRKEDDEDTTDRKRRKSRRDYDDDEMQDTYTREDSADRSRRREKRDRKSKRYDDDESDHKSRKHDRERRDRDYERAEKDKYRKRSRHERDDEDEEESSRRSRKHKKDHKDRDETDLGMRITGRSKESPMPDKDPHTLEREKRNKERLEKEQQRRQNAKELSGGRTRSVKYEDELDVRGRYSKSRRR